MYILSKEQQDKMLDQRLQEYAAKRFSYYLDVVALRAAGDDAAVDERLKRIKGLDDAATAIEALRGGGANADA
ncbi:hypothetical protein M3223_04040 [Paenibacillus pasadenensis]|uniref:hypothetical protein n=1 Tax=Paenibacillus pasadenensis TaxID=217090 RepID=UPI00203D567F|nr:hypothetical protein [Paenibacillus pasadenensis]MCM3746519.1 hypothetical protein [Paenibacillus pasadenensis]